MDLFIYSTVSEEYQKRLEDLFRTVFPKEEIRIYRTFDDLSQRLKLPGQVASVAVLAPGSREQLLHILSRRDLLRDLRTIVIAPDHEDETVAIAHRLRPRYLTHINGDFGDLAAVLRKMVTGHALNESSFASHLEG